MKRLFLILLLLSEKALAQNKDTIYRLESIYYLDANGNSYQTVKSYDHIPTSADSAEFRIKSIQEIHAMMDEQQRKDSLSSAQYNYNPAPKPRAKTSSKGRRH